MSTLGSPVAGDLRDAPGQFGTALVGRETCGVGSTESRTSPCPLVRRVVCAVCSLALAACGGPTVAVEVVNEGAVAVEALRVEGGAMSLGSADDVGPGERRTWTATLDRGPRADGSYSVTLRTDGSADTVVRVGYVTGGLLAESLRVVVRDRAVVVEWREQGRWVREAVVR